MAEQTVREQVEQRWGSLKLERSSWMSHWQEITTYLMPRNGRYFLQDRDRGQRRHNNIYDSTGTKALNTLGAGMMAGMTSPARPWFRLTTPDPDMMKSGPVKIWCADVTRMMLDVFQKGNTYRTLHALYRELGAFGTASTIVLDDFQEVIRHYPLTVGEFCIATNYRGDVDTLYRQFQKQVGPLVKEFGVNAVTPATKNLYDRHQLDKWITVTHAIEPRADRDPSMIGSKHMAWRSVYVEQGATANQVLRESGFPYFPALAPRWDTAGGDIWGNSPGMEALGDVKQLQHEQLRKAQGIDFMTKPPIQLPTGMKNRDVEGFPGGITFVDSTANPGVRNLFQVQLDLNHLLADIQDTRDRINSSFYADLFLMLANSTNPSMTATEVAERHEEKLLMLGPVLERLNDELLNPLVEMTFQRMIKAGVTPPPPPELQGQDLAVEFVSMLAQAQRAVGTNAVDRFTMQLGQIAAVKPEVLDKFDTDKWADIYSDQLGVDPEMIVADTKVALIRKQRAQQQAQQQQLEAANQAATAAKNASQAPTQGGSSNVANDVMNMFSGYGSGQSATQ